MANLVNSLNVFRGKRVLVTGDTGFKGSWLSFWLAELGAEVFGFAKSAQHEHDHFNVLNLSKRIHHQAGDICDKAALRAFFKEVEPEFVFHLAAQAIVRQSYHDPKETFETNVMGSINVLECVRETPSVHVLVYVTSDKCYKNKEWIWGYRENDELGGRDPYSASKAAAELVFESYSDSFFKGRPHFGYASVRAGNVIGGGDWATDRIVPDCIRALAAREPIRLRYPSSTRPWQHVLEPLSGYLMLAAALLENPELYSGAWNFGPDAQATATVKYLAEAIVSRWGDGKIECQAQTATLHEAGLLHVCSDKARHLLEWRSRWCFNDTVAATVDWYRGFFAGESIAHITSSQIKRYMESVE